MAMTEVGEAAARGSAPSALTLDRLRQLATAAPLDPEPFLVQAAITERGGDLDKAERLLIEARRRDPRSIAARYLLADVWLRKGRVVDALGEMAILGRLVPSSSLQMVPALAQYAQSPGAAAKLHTILDSNPQLREPLLNALAADPNNIDLILQLRGNVQRGTRDEQRWQSKLLGELISQGEFLRAHDLWRQLSGLPSETESLIFNPGFNDIPAPPPFDWEFGSSSAGFAEPGNGSMQVDFYGRDNAALAGQLLLLPPGNYAFLSPASGTVAPNALIWTLTCLSGGPPLMQLDLGAQGPGRPTSFTVPASQCSAQRLVLIGRGQDMPQESNVRIGPLRLERVTQ